MSHTVTGTICPKHIEIDLKLTDYQSLLVKQVYLSSYFDMFLKLCIVPIEKTLQIENKLRQKDYSPTNELFPIVSGIKIVTQ